jgi:transposase
MSVIVRDLIKNYYNADYNSQFDIDFAIKKMTKLGQLTTEELIVIKLTMDGMDRHQIAKAISGSASTVRRRLREVSDKLSEYLGEEYSDSKIVERVELKLGRQLTNDEKEFCWHMIRQYEIDKDTNLTIFNFKKVRNGRFVPRDTTKEEG